MRRAILALSLGACVLAAGCGGGKSNASATPLPFKRSTTLPKDFPTDLPLPADRKVVEVLSAGGGSVVFFSTKLSQQDAKTFILSGLHKGSWTVVNCQTQTATPSPVTVIAAIKDDRTAVISIGYVPNPQVTKHYSLYVLVSKMPSPTQLKPVEDC